VRATNKTVREEKISEEEWHIFFDPSVVTAQSSGSVRDLDLRALEPLSLVTILLTVAGRPLFF